MIRNVIQPSCLAWLVKKVLLRIELHETQTQTSFAGPLCAWTLRTQELWSVLSGKAPSEKWTTCMVLKIQMPPWAPLSWLDIHKNWIVQVQQPMIYDQDSFPQTHSWLGASYNCISSWCILHCISSVTLPFILQRVLRGHSYSFILTWDPGSAICRTSLSNRW